MGPVDKHKKYIAIIASFFFLLVIGGAIGLFFKFRKNSPPNNSNRNEEISGNHISELPAPLVAKYKSLLETPKVYFSHNDTKKLNRLKLLVKLLKTESPKNQKKLAKRGELVAGGGSSILQSFIEAYTSKRITCVDITNCIEICENIRKFENQTDDLYISYHKIQNTPGNLSQFFPHRLVVSYTAWFSGLPFHYSPFFKCSNRLSIDSLLLLENLMTQISPAIRKGIIDGQEQPPTPLAQRLMDWVGDGKKEKFTILRTVLTIERLRTALEAFSKDDLNAIRGFLAVFKDIFPYTNELVQNLPSDIV
jgi:hypothetical protein